MQKRVKASVLAILMAIAVAWLGTSFATQATAAPGVTALTCTPPAADPEIAALARALNYNHALIYEYVYYNIENSPTYGSKKGALGTYLDRKGTNMDQNVLFVSLLRQSCITANYRFGVVGFPAASVANLLGTANDAAAMSSVLGDGAIPNCILLTSTATTCSTTGGAAVKVQLQTVWTEYTVGTTTYDVDPSYKAYTYYTPINIATAMGYNQANFLATATAGSSAGVGLPAGVNSLKNLSKANIATALNTFSANLAAYIKANYPSYSTKQLFGGRDINNGNYGGSIPATAGTLCTEIGNCTTTVNALETVYTITVSDNANGSNPSIMTTLYGSQITGKRLTLTYAGTVPKLVFEGTLLATGTASAVAAQTVTVTVTVPYPAPNNVQTASPQVKVGGTFSIMLAAGDIGRDTLTRHQKAIANYIAAGNTSTSEPVLGESLAAVGAGYLSQSARASDLYLSMTQSIGVRHFAVGIAGITTAPYVDFPMQVSSLSITNNKYGIFIARALFNSSLESTAVTQISKDPAVSTVRMFDYANTDGTTLIQANNANWASIRPLLVGWSAGELTAMDSFFAANAANTAEIVLPQNGSRLVGTWTGSGYLRKSLGASSNSVGYLISGGYKGGFGYNSMLSGDLYGYADTYSLSTTEDTQYFSPLSYEPIDMLSGAYTYDHEDLKAGSAAFPFSLTVKRSYNSASASTKSALGYGWRHNFMMSAITDSDSYQQFGDINPTAAVPTVVAFYTMQDLLTGTTPALANTVSSSLSASWLMDQLVNNAITVTLERGTKRFVKIPTATGAASYVPPPGDGSTIAVDASNNITITDKNGMVSLFNSTGQITSWQDLNGNKLQFTNGTYGPTQVCGVYVGTTAVHCITFTYNASGQLTQIAEPSSSRTNGFAYDAAGNLASRTDATGKITTYAYQAGSPGLLTKTFYPSNPTTAFMTNVYDSFGKIQTQADAFGNVWYYMFANGSRSMEVDPNGGTHTYYYDRNGNPIIELNQVSDRTSTYYDGIGRVINTVKPAGDATALTYDANSNVLTKTQNPISGATDPLTGLAATPIVESWTYNSLSKPLTHTDPRGYVTSYAYDTRGNLLTMTQPAVSKPGVAGTATPVTTYTYNANGLPLTVADPEGRVTGNTYDTASGKLDLLQTVQDQGTGRLNITTTYTYDAAGNVLTVTDPLNHIATNSYDLERRQTQTVDAAGDITKYTYDADGRKTSTAQSTANSTTFVTSTTTYDVGGKTLTVTAPDGATQTTGYDTVGRAVTQTSSSGRQVLTAYDLASRVTAITDQVSGALDASITSNLGAVTRESHTYYTGGLLATLTDGKGSKFTFYYDGFERQYDILYPDDTPTARDYELHAFDAAGNEKIWQRRNHGQVVYTYDALNRLYTKVPTGQATISYGYDYSGKQICAQASTDTYCHQYYYDTAGRKYAEYSPTFGTTTSLLDLAGNHLTLGSNSYTYDVANRLSAVYQGSVATGTRVEGLSYDLASRRIAASYGPVAAPIASSTYGYTPASQIASLGHSFTTGSVSFTLGYNQDHQRKSLSTTDSTFLPAGLTTGTKSYTANNLNQYSAVAGAAFTYDANGNLTSDGTWTYSYDTEGHLLSSVKAGTSVTYTYDPFGRRKTKTINGTTITYYASYGDRELTEYTGTVGTTISWTKRFIYSAGLDEPVASYDPLGNILYQFADVQGSVIAQVNNLGQVTEKHGYTSYGLSNSLGTNTASYQYAGRRLDQDTGLYYNRARYYAPALGRFLSPDPAFTKGGLNLYAYTSNDPLNHTDPHGKCIEDLCIGEVLLAFEFVDEFAAAVDITAGVSEGALALPGPGAGAVQAWDGLITSDVVPDGGITAYRYWGGGSDQVGSWLSPFQYESSSSAIESLALPPGNTAEYMSEVYMPAGTRYQFGTAADAFGQPGGGSQIQLLDRIDPSNFGEGMPFK